MLSALRSIAIPRWLVAPLLAALAMAAGPQAPAPLAEIALGERMYREGLLPSGEPMRGTVRGDVEVEGAAFACTSCHLRGGLGSVEGGIVTPPTNAEKLYRPWYRYHPALTGDERKVLPEANRNLLRRPAYTDEALVRAITEGVDPVGRPLDDIMPRYALTSEEAGALVHYLKGLSAEPSPGVTATTLTFATVIAGEVNAEDRADLLEVLRYRIGQHNRRGENRAFGGYRALAALEGSLGFRDWELLVWELKGPARTWPAQLEAYFRHQPVFALLSGLSYQPWAPIHEFCEAHQLPCLFPMTDLPQTQGPSWYTLYFSKGPFQEGAAAAAFLAGTVRESGGKPMLQVVADSPEARALARGFDSGWAEHGLAPVRTMLLSRGARPDPRKLLADMMGQGPAPVLLLWTGPEAYPGLTRLAPPPEGLVLMSTSLLGPKLWDLPQGARDMVRLTYPYRLFRPPASMTSQSGAAPSPPAQLRLVAGDTHRRIRSRAFAAMKSLEEVTSHMGRNYYRDHLLDGFGMLMDDSETDYERLSYGPGQRFASKGCYVVRLPQGRLHGFLQESDWIIH
jgi:hypothetical protein